MRAIMVIASLLVASPGVAQTVLFTVPISDIVAGGISAEPVDTDGDVNTQEWLVEFSDGSHRVVAQRNWCLCWGRPINRINGINRRRSIGLYRGRPVLILSASTTEEYGHVSVVVALETPSCGLITPPPSEP